ncbi:hypothetical protein QUG98_00840 [Curtobacterium sp. RHCJP20]|uniref:Uncharacterized protein n=1 Tax=Curtobacterium subtropicum TaxID=3055138 RepID=A0ABT7TBM6_9MICO|nr:hypothetical protein [Curtobacterium subtropicum]MDM7886987.1 hypothetical protein [Curtobacterium subtropicum]
MQSRAQEPLVVGGAVLAALLPALAGAVHALPVVPGDVSPRTLVVGAVVSGIAALVVLVLSTRRRDPVRSAVALSALALAVSWFVSGVFVVVLVAVAQAALLAAGVLARRAHRTGPARSGQGTLGLLLGVLAALWFVALLATSSVPLGTDSQVVLLTWFAAPNVFQAAAYLVAVVLVAGPVWTGIGRGVRSLRESAEVR